MYSNEAERAGQDIIDDLKLKKKPLVSMVYIKDLSALMVKGCVCHV